MNVRKHVAGFAVFLIILTSAIVIHEYLNFPGWKVRPVRVTTPPPPRRVVKSTQPVDYRVRQVSLDYVNRKSYTEVVLTRQPGRPAPDRIWVMTGFYSPDSARAEEWNISAELKDPFGEGDEVVFVAESDWDLPPLTNASGAGYFARVHVSSEYEGRVSPPDYGYSESGRYVPIPVVVHWPVKQGASASAPGKFSR
jgi:hypothetical protein